MESGQSIAATARSLGVVEQKLFGSLKVERVHGIRLETRRQAKDAIIDWLVWYNSHRLHSTPGNMRPMLYEQHWLAGHPKTVNL